MGTPQRISARRRLSDGRSLFRVWAALIHIIPAKARASGHLAEGSVQGKRGHGGDHATAPPDHLLTCRCPDQAQRPYRGLCPPHPHVLRVLDRSGVGPRQLIRKRGGRRVDYARKTCAHGTEFEVIAWRRAQEASRRDYSWHVQEAFELGCYRSESPVVPRIGTHDDSAHHPVSALHLHELPADLCEMRLPHRGPILDPGQQRAVGQFLAQLLGFQEE